jgi:asparagine synthase (glutamine-hydrolysing)
MSVISLVWTEYPEQPVSSLHNLTLSAFTSFVTGRRSHWNDDRIAFGGWFTDSLPEDKFDRQPLWSQDRSACVVADVRLDNRRELARELGLTQPETLADSEFLLAAWLRWGAECPKHLLGGFAFFIWSPATREIFAARDHAGERPLFYYRTAELFAISSLPKGILALPSVSRRFDEGEMAKWLAALSPDLRRSMFADVQRVPPGHTLRVSRGALKCTQYWHPASAKPTRLKRDEDYAEALVDLLDSATEARLRSTRDVGSFLSAGLDSSSVTASAARLQLARGRKLSAFTSVPRPGFNGLGPPSYLPSEGASAAEIARMYPNIDHQIVDSSGYDLLRTIRIWTDAMDAPTTNVINLLWFHAILDRAREQGIGVMLQGLAGNITISWYTWTILGHFFLRGRWMELIAIAKALRHRQGLSYKTSARYATRGVVPCWLTRLLIDPAPFEGMYDRLASPEWMDRFHLRDQIFRMMYCRPADFTRDRSAVFESYDEAALWTASQALTGIEIRDPTADKRIYDFCFSIPPEQYFVGGHSRSLVRRAMKGRLPEATLMSYRRGLQGADWYIPMTDALPELGNELELLGRSPAAQRALNLAGMHSLLDSWPKSDFHTMPVMRRWHHALIPAFSLGYFLRTHEAIGGYPPELPDCTNMLV